MTMKNLTDSAVSRRAFLGGTAVAAALGLAACGGGASTASSGKDGKESGGTTGGGVITAGSAYAPSSYDPYSTGSAVLLGTNWHVIEGLYGIDYHDYSTFNELATGDPKQIDDTTFEVTIRDGAKYSDGTDVVAEDVATAFQRAKDGGTYTSFMNPIASIEAKDKKTVTITTAIPNFGLLKDRLAIIRVCPASMSIEELAKRPVGSGPWMYESTSDTTLELVPNPNYNGELKPSDTKIHIDILTDATARVNAQREGSTLVMEMVTADAVEQVEAAGCKVDNVQGFGTRFLMFNVAKAPWDNVKARQAVMYALNVDQMVSNAFAGLASPATCYLPDSFANYHKASTVYTYDQDKAKSLIKDAGITPGAITLRTTDNEQVKAMATQVKNDLDAIGFNVTIQTDTSPATYAAIDGGEAYDLLLAPGDPSCFGGDTDLLLNWWFGDNVWMQTRCPWGTSDEWKHLSELMHTALGQSGDEQQQTWNECFDILAENVVLYPVVHVKTVTASWADPKAAPNGVAIDGFKGIGTTGMTFLGAKTVSA